MGAGDISGDRALFALTVRDVWSHPVLLGPYSRFFWHHPGPLYAYLLSLPNALFGGQTLGLVLGATLINALAAAGIVYLAFRRQGPALAVWTSLVVGVYLAALGPAAFDPWNPSATVVPFALVLMLGWSLACGDVWAAPWLVLASSFCIQTHVALVPGVLAACTTAVAVAVIRHRRATGCFGAMHPALVAAGVLGLLLWFPPLIEQVTSNPGNLTLLVRFFSRSSSQHPVSAGLKQAAFQMTLVPRAVLQHDKLTNLEGHTAFGYALVGSVVAFISTLTLSIKAKATDVVILIALVTLEFCFAIYSVTRIVGRIDYYLVEWISVVGLMLWVALGAAVIAWLAAHVREPRRSLQIVSAIAVGLAVCGVAIGTGSDATVGSQAYTDPTQQFLSNAILAASDHSGRVGLALGSESAWPTLAGTALTLEQDGVDVSVVRSNDTALLFDGSYLIDSHAGGVPFFVVEQVRSTGRAPSHEHVIARSGRWVVARST